MASYPSDLPKPVISGYTGKQSDTFIRSPYQTGLAEQRKLYSNAAYFQTVTFVFTSAQARKFEGFIRYEISDGCDWFDLELILPDGTKTRRVRLVDVYESPKTYGSKNNWEINATLELLVRPLISERDYYGFPFPLIDAVPYQPTSIVVYGEAQVTATAGVSNTPVTNDVIYAQGQTANQQISII